MSFLYLLDGGVAVLRVEAVRSSEHPGKLELGLVHIDGKDPGGLPQHRSLNHGEANRPQPENGHRGTFFNVAVVHDGSKPRGYAAPKQASLRETN